MTKGEITISHTNLTTIANPLRAFYLDKKKTALIYPRTIIALSMLHRTKLKCLDYVGGGDIYSHREFSIEPFNPSSNPILYLLSAQVPHTIHFGKYGGEKDFLQNKAKGYQWWSYGFLVIVTMILYIPRILNYIISERKKKRKNLRALEALLV